MATKTTGTKKAKKGQKAKKPTATKSRTKPAQAADAALVAKFWKCVRDGATRSEGRQLVRSEFPRETWGKAGDVARRLTEYRSFAAAFESVHTPGREKGGAR